MNKHINYTMRMIICLLILVFGIAVTGCGNKKGSGADDTKAAGITQAVEAQISQGEDTESTQSEASDAEELDAEESGESESQFRLAEFNALTLDGESFTQEALANYDLTVINLWATWCLPCVLEMPDIAELSKELPDNVRLITYCLDYDDISEVSKVLNKAGYEGVTIVDADGDMSRLADACEYIPTTVFVDSEGNSVHDILVGGQSRLKKVYLDAINESLGKLGKDEISLK